MLVASWFVLGMLYFMLYCYLFSTLVCNLKFVINWKIIVASSLIGITNIILLSIDVSYLKPYFVHGLSLILLIWIYKQKLIKTLLGVLFSILLVTISELGFGMTFVLILDTNFDEINNNVLMGTLVNVVIFVLIYLSSKIKYIRKFINSIIKWYSDNEYRSLLIFVFLFLTISIFLLYNNFVKILPQSFLWLTNIFCIAVYVFAIGFFKERTTKNKIIYEYDQLLDYVKTYEMLLDEKSKNQHEYKNQLAVIRVMVKNKKTLDYIDSLLNNEVEENLETVNKLKYIPKGGLKGLIYYKIESMKKKKINIFVDVSRELNNRSVWLSCDNNLKDISKILGVYLDNAIEAAENTKGKYVSFEVYMEDDKIVFKISNTYKNIVEIDKVDKEGYTTKGKGKGYGLALVKDIINKNIYIEQSREIINDYYIQKLYIKNKV